MELTKTKMEKYYQELRKIDNYWILKLIKIILNESEACAAPTQKLPQAEEAKKAEEAEKCISVTIDSFPKSCHKFILNKPKKISWSSPEATIFYYNDNSNTL
jgi:hypothetical protein